jgi:uncharacterized protein
LADITPQVPDGRQLIQAYGGGGFRIAGTAFRGSVVVLRGHTELWSIANAGDVTLASLETVFAEARRLPIDILLIGSGAAPAPFPAALRAELRTFGMVLEWMDTGAACRTFNILLAEERRIAAALIAVA